MRQVLEVVLSASDQARIRGWRSTPGPGPAASAPVEAVDATATPVQPALQGRRGGGYQGRDEGFHYLGWDLDGGEVVYLTRSARHSARRRRPSPAPVTHGLEKESSRERANFQSNDEEDEEDEEEEEAEEEVELCTLLCHGNSISMVLAEGRPEAEEGESQASASCRRASLATSDAQGVLSYVRYIKAAAGGGWRQGRHGGGVGEGEADGGDDAVERRSEAARFDIRVRCFWPWGRPRVCGCGVCSHVARVDADGSMHQPVTAQARCDG